MERDKKGKEDQSIEWRKRRSEKEEEYWEIWKVKRRRKGEEEKEELFLSKEAEEEDTHEICAFSSLHIDMKPFFPHIPPLVISLFLSFE